jgi:hypothetical protein
MDMDITFCTFFFDINRSNWDTFAVHSNTYMHWFKNVLSLDINLHIQTEEKFIDVIREERKKIDPEFKKTIIKITKIEHLEAWKQYNSILEDLMFSDKFKQKVCHNVPEMTKPLYNVLMFHKVHYLKEIIKTNPFDTKYFSWVDTGFIRDCSWPINNQQWPCLDKLNLKNNKVRFFCINDDVIQGLSNTTKEDHCMSQMRFLKGTIFFLDKTCITRLCDLFDKNARQCIKDGFIGSDEKIFDLCYCEDSELFELVKCDWRAEFHLYAKNQKQNYSFDITWNLDDISKHTAYKFWYVGIEDSTTAVIHRNDFNPEEHPDICDHVTNCFTVNFESQTRPHRVVIWPVDKDGNWLQRVEYPIHL